jgi:hypothetical protein
MEIIKTNKILISIVVIILILVIVRAMDVNHFKSDAKRWAEKSMNHSNTVTPEQVRILKGSILAINLDNKMMPGEKVTGDLRNISADSILSRKIFKSILKHNGPVLIYSDKPALSARIWMVLSQMGCKELYILTSETGNEIPGYKIQPDSK